MMLTVKVRDLQPLPGLSNDEHRSASDLIQALLDAFATAPPHRLDFDELAAVASHLRTIGDPAAAETLADMAAHRFLERSETTNAIALYNMAGLACFDQGALEDAGHHFMKALSLIPSPDSRLQTPVLLINHATVMTEMGGYEQALLLYERTIRELDSSPPGSYGQRDALLPQQVRGLVTNNIGWVLLRSARAAGNDRELIARAVTSFDAALQLPLHPRTRLITWGNRAEASIMLGETESAAAALTTMEAECLSAGYQKLLPEAYRRRAQLEAAMGNVDTAIEWTLKAMQTSIQEANPRQELRIVEVFLDILHDVVSRAADPYLALESSGATVVSQIVALLESKDTYTGGSHSRRVAELARRIACRMVGDGPGQQKWVKRVELGGLFHDVGKLRIPWSLLNRVPRLSRRDWELLKAHTTTGEAILRDLGLWSLALVAGGHHERPDGAGYPRGDTRSTIEAAIVAAADSFDAMASPSRLYTLPKTFAEALAEVQRGSGTQFRPDIVEALVAVVDETRVTPELSHIS
jgi:HD-GYP domain-containing protein (c-di-GMP phosphodiesterase class II)